MDEDVAGGRAWHVLLVGGASGVGKSELVAALLRHHVISSAESDDLLAAVRAMTTPATHPALHRRLPENAHVEQVVQAQSEIAEALQPAVRAVVDTHLDHGPPVILEGDYLLPGLMDGQDQWDSVRMIILHEQDRKVIAANLARREPERPDQHVRAHVSWLYGQFLRREAAAHAVPVLAARPWRSHVDRLSEILQQRHPQG